MGIEHGLFDAADLVRCYARPNLRSVMAGNKVELRSGGPEMTVVETDGADHAIANWLDANGTLQTARFALACLTCADSR